MASMRDIKRRKTSVQNTQQITKAMKLVSTVKLQRARAAAERSKAYFEYMYRTVNSILMRTGNMKHRYLQPGESAKKAVIAITSNRGLAGGYNSNIIKLIIGQKGWEKDDVVIYAVGNKGREALERHGYEVCQDWSFAAEEPAYTAARDMADALLKEYDGGEVGEIYLAYTSFVNTVSHVPTLIKLLPAEVPAPESVQQRVGEGNGGFPALMNFEMEDEAALDLIIPKYVASMIYGGLVEAAASENGARMQAMDNATSNAEEMISDLTLKYNRARQGSITQELTEIIAGAEAIS